MSHDIKAVYVGALGEIRYSALRTVDLQFPTTEGLSLKFAVEGTEHYAVNGETFKVEKNQFLVFRPGFSYAAMTKGNALNEGFCIDLNMDFLQDAKLDLFGETPLFDFTMDLECTQWHQPDYPWVQLMQSIYQTLGQQSTLFFEEALNQMMHHYLQVEQAYQDKVQAIPALKKSTRKELIRKLWLAKAFLHDNLSQNLTLEDIAKASGLSKFYLQRLFKQVFQYSPQQYHEALKLNRALEMLQSNQYQVHEVSYTLGYSDLPYFCRRFKKYFGKSPRQYLRLGNASS